MKTLADFQNTVFYINNGEVESSTYQEFLQKYWSDETTSPRGVENRLQIASFLIDEDGDVITYSLNDLDGLVAEEGECIKWGVRSWGVGGRGPSKLVSDLFDIEEEAEVLILESMEQDFLTRSCNDRPCVVYDTYEEALSDLAEGLGLNVEVLQSIKRKEKLVKDARKAKSIANAERENALFIERVNKYASLITKVEPENYKQTAGRLSTALGGERLPGGVFHAVVKKIRA